MKWSSPSWLRARSGHAVMALALGGIALIGVAHRVADQQAQDLMALHEDIDIIRISIERSLAPLQFPVDVPLSLAQRARSLGELDRAKRSAEQLVQRSTRARLETFYQASDYQLPRGAATLAQAIAEQRAAIKNALHHADPGHKLALQAGVRQLRTQVNALDDALATHFVQRRNGLYRLHALMMASVAALGAVGLWLLQREQGRRHRAANVLRLREDQLQALVAAVPDVVALLDANGRVLASSSTRPEWALGHSSAASPMPLSEILPRTLCDAVLGKIQSCIDDKRVSAFEYQREINSQAISFDSRLSPLRDRQQVVWVSWDITARTQSERRAKVLGSHYNFLSHVNQAIVWIRDADSLLQRICAIATQHGDFSYAWFASRMPGQFALHAQHMVRANDAIDHTQHVSVLLEHPDSPLHSSFLGSDVLCLNLAEQPATTAWQAHLLRIGLAGLVLIAIRSDHSDSAPTLGLLVLHSRDIDAYDDEHRALLEEIAGDTSYALGRIRRDEERQQMARRVRLHAAALDATRDGVMVTNPQGIVLSVNGAFSQITGIAERDAVGNISFLRQTLEASGYSLEGIETALQTQGFWKGELLGRLPSGRMHTLALTVSRVVADDRAEESRVVVFSDLTQQREDEARLRRVAQFDPLTGLPNRSSLLSRLEHALPLAEQHHSIVALLYVDLDSFRTVNDSLGHHQGDELLRQVALRLSEQTPPGCTLARLGGDEFVVLAEDLRNNQSAMQLARDLHNSLRQRIDIVGAEPVYLQASIGICLYPEIQGAASILIRNAELAMFEAKRAGRNAIRFFTNAMGAAAVQRLAVETRLRRAIAQGEFVLHYQPLWDLCDDRLVGLEALVRLDQPSLPHLGPADFIPVLEQIGQIETLGDWVTREACRQARAWLDAGWDFGIMAVNLSPVEVARHPVEQRIRSALQESGLAAERIEVEITESGLMEQGDRAEEFLRRLHALGVRIAIDDFGTGYSSLAYLRRFPVNKLKIDRSFVAELTTDERNARLVDSMLQLGISLGIEVLAEGVETAAQASHLRDHGCKTIQGYFISPPLPADQVWARYGCT